MKQIKLASLFTVRVEVGSRLLLGGLPQGYARRISNVSGGSFAGERLHGKVLAGGADIVLERPDRTLHLDVRLVLETDQGELVYMTYSGRYNGPTPDPAGRLRQGEPIPANNTYLRLLIQFETAAPRLAWLNDKLAVGTGTSEAIGPVYDVWEVL